MRQGWIESALDGTGWTYAEVMEGVEKGFFHLFENERAAMVCEFIVSPRHEVFHCWAAGGDMAGFCALIPVAEDFARKSGCDMAGGTGRKGWVRAMEKLGYKAATPAVEKEL